MHLDMGSMRYLVAGVLFIVGILGYIGARRLIGKHFHQEIARWAERCQNLQHELEEKNLQLNICESHLQQARDEEQKLRQALLSETEKRAAYQQQAQQLAGLREELDQSRKDYHQALELISELKQEQASLETRLRKEMEANEEKLDTLRKAGEELKRSFQQLATDALKANNEMFLDLAQSTLQRFHSKAEADLHLRQKAVEQLVQPLKDVLTRYEQELKALERQRQEAYSKLAVQAENLGSAQAHLISETSKLVKALRQPQVRGRWGEMTLRRVVELAGMSPYCDFTTQPTVGDKDKRLRPDLVVHLPGNRLIVIDSKVPLQSYLDAIECNDESERNHHLNSHAKQVRTHMQQLASKNYWNQFSQSPDFVVLFLPGESFFSAALGQDAGLIETGIRQKVILATPTTLIALLRSIAYGWQQQLMTENAEAICRLGKEFHERLGRFAVHVQELGNHLRRCVIHYNRTLGTLESRVLVTARKFQEMGISEGRPLPELEQIEEQPRSLKSEQANNNEL